MHLPKHVAVVVDMENFFVTLVVEAVSFINKYGILIMVSIKAFRIGAQHVMDTER